MPAMHAASTAIFISISLDVMFLANSRTSEARVVSAIRVENARWWIWFHDLWASMPSELASLSMRAPAQFGAS